MAKRNFNYDDFNKPQKQKKENFRPLLMAVIAIFGIGYLLVYRVYFSSQPDSGSISGNTAVTSVSENAAGPDKQEISDPADNTESSDTDANASVNTSVNDIPDGISSYTEDIKTGQPEAVMYTDERITYQDGFFYQPITEDIKERIYGLSYKTDCTIPYEDLRYLSVRYYDFENQVQTGEIICNKAIAEDLVEIFYELYCNAYQIDKIRLVDEYQADDDLSCADNNTSCFNFRTVDGTQTLSKHAQGLAIDINPFQNPYVTYPDGKERISPEGSEPYADRSSGLAHIITEDDLCYQLFTAHGFTWGGHWKSLKDYQHFQKAL